MSEQFHTDIHKDCFKLRILTTNACNLNCSYCLNDFQPKPKSQKDWKFIDPWFVNTIISAYLEVCRIHNVTPEIYYSGGESTIHPEFDRLVNLISSIPNSKTVLCTNGLALTPLQATYFSELHISLHRYSTLTRELMRFKQLLEGLNWTNPKMKIKEVVFSTVLTDNVDDPFGLSEVEIDQIWNRIQTFDIPIKIKMKVWCNYWRSRDVGYMKYYHWYLREHPWIINRGPDFNPQNRGHFCERCTRECVTLKALWVFPDNTVYPCPQSPHRWTLDYLNPNWDLFEAVKLVNQAYQGHKAI